LGHFHYRPHEALYRARLSRLTHFTRGLSASWMASLVTVLYGLASVPIALRFLSVEEFGLFMLMLQVAGYFTLIELGMAGATARILMDYKDDQENGAYGSVIVTGSLVFTLQALAIAATGFVCAPWVVHVVGVPAELLGVAIYLLRWLCFTFAIATGLRIFGSLLYANKRLDLLNAITAGTILIGLVLMLVILASGAGLRGLVVMFVLQTTLAVLLHFFACWRLGFLPPQGCWGRPTFARFRELFGLAKDFFMVSAGSQVLEASQLIIVTRTMGLTATATWSVSTKIFALLFQLLTKIQGTGVVFLSEMMVRGESQRLETRFRQICQLTAGLAAVTLAVAVAVNQPFVSTWAKPDLAWGISVSALMGALVFLNAVTRCHVDLIIHTKKILALRYVYFLEAAAFVGMAFWLTPKIGFYGVLFSSLVCLVLARLWYAALRVAAYFGVRPQLVWWSWMRRSLLAILLLAPFVWTSGAIAGAATLPWVQLALVTLWVGAPALVVMFAIALPSDVAGEIRQYFRALAPFLTGRS
jgi:O-antigen/teichoic acid export membrane protein